MTETPIFRSAHEALTFAFKYDRNRPERPMYARMGDKPTGQGRGLGGLDGAGQAGMILRHVDALSPAHRAIITLMYAPRTKTCMCCQGDTPSHEWYGALRELSGIAAGAALSGCVSNNRLRDGIIARLFGERIVLAELAERCRVEANTASNHNQKVTRWLKGERDDKPNRQKGEQERAVQAIEESLLQSGHIERAA